jgi:nickel transport protein
MPARIRPLRPVAWFFILLVTFLAAGDARAHRLDAQVFVLPNRKIQVESWFSTGDAAHGAKVEVFGAQGQLLTEGQLNDQGVFVFPYGDADPVRVVISAGAGHRKEVAISTKALARAAAAETTNKDSLAGTSEASSLPVPVAERDTGIPIKDVLIGVGFLLAVAAFLLSVRNAHKLRELTRSEKPTTDSSAQRFLN